MTSIPRASGIYRIVCSTNGKVYIGSAANLWQRKREHFKYLRGNRHQNSYLQRSWNKYGAHAFQFEVIELVLLPFLLEREQYWLDRVRSYDKAKGYNICRVAGSSLGVVASEQRRNRQSAARAKPIAGFISPDGERVDVVNLRDFCRERGLSKGAMHALAAGKQVQHKGWRHVNAPGYSERVVWNGLISPDGNPVPTIYSLRSFCLQHGLVPNRMYDLVKGRINNYRGWTVKRGGDL